MSRLPSGVNIRQTFTVEGGNRTVAFQVQSLEPDGSDLVVVHDPLCGNEQELNRSPYTVDPSKYRLTLAADGRGGTLTFLEAVDVQDPVDFCEEGDTVEIYRSSVAEVDSAFVDSEAVRGGALQATLVLLTGLVQELVDRVDRLEAHRPADGQDGSDAEATPLSENAPPGIGSAARGNSIRAAREDHNHSISSTFIVHLLDLHLGGTAWRTGLSGAQIATLLDASLGTGWRTALTGQAVISLIDAILGTDWQQGGSVGSVDWDAITDNIVTSMNMQARNVQATETLTATSGVFSTGVTIAGGEITHNNVAHNTELARTDTLQLGRGTSPHDDTIPKGLIAEYHGESQDNGYWLCDPNTNTWKAGHGSLSNPTLGKIEAAKFIGDTGPVREMITLNMYSPSIASAEIGEALHHWQTFTLAQLYPNDPTTRYTAQTLLASDGSELENSILVNTNISVDTRSRRGTHLRKVRWGYVEYRYADSDGDLIEGLTFNAANAARGNVDAHAGEYRLPYYYNINTAVNPDRITGNPSGVDYRTTTNLEQDTVFTLAAGKWQAECLLFGQDDQINNNGGYPGPAGYIFEVQDANDDVIVGVPQPYASFQIWGTYIGRIVGSWQKVEKIKIANLKTHVFENTVPKSFYVGIGWRAAQLDDAVDETERRFGASLTIRRYE